MAELTYNFSACIVSGGSELIKHIEALRGEYSPMCGEYFDYITGKRGRNSTAFTESACALILLDNLLKKHGIDRMSLAISRNADGRPCVINRNDLDFSVSHSEGAALCCIAIGADASVGADIQFARNYSRERMEELARTFMSQSELNSFLRSSTRADDFFRAWTKRESYYKRCGHDDVPAPGRFTGGIVASCGKRYYYSISLPEQGE